ncbi:MAG: membrane protein insertion efficiency factor YidD [bacterium]|nr:membrane protein insertion efficiency factor YidD [Pseudomonadales bacterium]
MFKRLVLLFIRTYQLSFSLLMGPRCRFYPSCSEYAKEAIEVHGVAKGVVLATARICKCHPFHPGGVDPVPANEQIKV